MSESVALAPAAGSGVGKLLADRLLADPEFLDDLVAACKNGLKATRTYYVSTGKGEGHHETEPDFRTQLQAVGLLLGHMEGDPVKRVVHQHLGGNGQRIDPLAALQESPELRAAARRLLDKAEFRTRRGKHSEPVEAETVEVG